MPCVRKITSKTPGKGKGNNLLNLSEYLSCFERCVNCDGTFLSMKHNHLKKEQRIGCSVCKRRTTQFCWKCWRYSCNEAPLNESGL